MLLNRRRSGILLHLTSLPSPYGIGDLGPGACEFARFLKEAGQSYWQILPLNPTRPDHGNSPYNSYSAFACNPLLISPELLVEEGLLSQSDIEDHPPFPERCVDYRAVTEYKYAYLNRAYEHSFHRIAKSEEFLTFQGENADWLDDYALFAALKKEFHGREWNSWPRELRDREPDALKECTRRLEETIRREKFYQYIFFRQWSRFKDFLCSMGISIIGDVPIYVSYESSDVWAHPWLFKLDDEKRPRVVAGVPPDYFSSTGQLWGNPVYDWDALKRTGYSWWLRRMELNLKLFDLVRLDHFRGFVACWEVDSGEDTALNGRWVEAPAEDFFSTMLARFHELPVIAEDLGYITPDVTALMERFGLPGMKLLIFAFGPDIATHPYAPHNYTRNCVVYTGTHDNNTIVGWFREEASGEEKERLFKYIGRTVTDRDVHIELVRLAMFSCANTAIIPMQDILGLGSEARMNVPSSPEGHWTWRLRKSELTPDVAARLHEMTWIYGRSP